jgi:hypothetical protein
VGEKDDALIDELTRESLLHRIDGGWEMRTGDDVVGATPDDRVRITVSWKGEIHDDDEPTDELDLDRVVDTFVTDLRRRGAAVTVPEDPHHDDAWVSVLAETYGRRPPRVPR